MRSPFLQKKGFTLVELMLTVTILAILVVVVTPKFAELFRRSKEGATKGSLSALRSGSSMYSASEFGVYAQNLISLTTQYIDVVPTAKLGKYHNDSASELTVYTSTVASTDVTDVGGWIYSSQSGEVTVNCTHTDRENIPFYTW
ncbi:MAG: hypothetical protein A3B80_06665 [Elusimicrobia bacterium RIFCSPHIGHO2_02_FULL_39_36]|nr:MAG: hypothetical protein A3B80_06665 [Elusimicrobia bacterium RIFCSPHIGHO2_02_FULL_39_36]OGS00640.1 MAG: hypothetical protein A3G85_02745 [Elusimicrobia bacterium RIFCSPLOWO2_12_FULL_39_28]